MRAPDTLTLGTTTAVIYTLAFPQDGTTQPATYLGPATNRALRKQASALVRPNANDALSNVAKVELVHPVVRSVEGVDRAAALIRGSIDLRIPKEASNSELAAFKDELATLVADAIFSAITSGDRLV